MLYPLLGLVFLLETLSHDIDHVEYHAVLLTETGELGAREGSLGLSSVNTFLD